MKTKEEALNFASPESIAHASKGHPVDNVIRDRFGFGTKNISSKVIEDYGNTHLAEAVLQHFETSGTYVSPDVMTDEIARDLIEALNNKWN